MNGQRPTDREEQRIRETAYHLWEKDGRPLGQAERYWEMARNIAEEPEQRHAMSEAEPEAVKPSKPKAKKPSKAKSKKSNGEALADHSTH